ncbi:DUF4251 domain-containing protein [Aureibaculum sp. 2210JD6-5]|uniref:DUF4251 domain-containing protein n=1 Tax=Aureibaculum sp. 2210JD6-5 TaxID=3103957 RepID=UPI002AAE2323|nr:DUF4251 domain-containing protein [Aureibaculum sp. 2210JD6-5]MDY7394111.1 DUF4251 domain-containing protein [Aureibaculum sp. 2210JD6-5]
MKSIYIYLFIAVLVSSCATTKVVDTTHIKEIVENQDYNIESDIAQPSATIGMSQLQNSGLLGVGNSASNINLIGNSNFLKIMGDSISSYLPYYGERHSNVGYGNDDGGIEFKGKVKDYNVVWDDKKQNYHITFKARGNNELFDVRIVLYPNLKSYVTLSSPSRTNITYVGKVDKIKDKIAHK